MNCHMCGKLLTGGIPGEIQDSRWADDFTPNEAKVAISVLQTEIEDSFLGCAV